MEAALGRRGPLSLAALLLFSLTLGVLVAIDAGFFIDLLRIRFSTEPGGVLLGPDAPYWTSMFVLFAAIPGALLMGWRDFTRGMSAGQRGFLAGVAYGLWSLSCVIAIPWMGRYPSLWAGLILLPVGWLEGEKFWLAMYLLNLTVCPIAGFFYFKWLARSLRTTRPEPS